jgi:hypothetical protein
MELAALVPFGKDRQGLGRIEGKFAGEGDLHTGFIEPRPEKATDLSRRYK